MNKKLFLYSVPIVLVPYLALFALAAIFFFATVPFFRWLMETIFDNNALYLIAALFLYCLLAVVLSVVFFFVSIRKNWDALSLAKFAMIVKLIQAPAYLCIFVLGCLFLVTIFTIPFTIGLFLIDCLSVFITGLFVISSVIIAIRQNIFTFKEVFWVILLQFIFCADVIASVVFYIKLKRLMNEKQHLKDSFVLPEIEKSV